MKAESHIDVREAIMDAATHTVQQDGYNALSFRDLAEDVGVKSSTVHYYFRTKGDLAHALVGRFREDFLGQMEALEDKSYDDAIDSYIATFRSGFDGSNRMCVGGMMSAEVSALPDFARDSLKTYVEAHHDFLRAIIVKKQPNVSADVAAGRAAAIFAAMEGVQLITRGLGGDPATFDGVVDTYRSTGLFG